MRTVNTNIFKYSELSSKAQEAVKSHYIENLTDWHNPTLEDVQQIATYLGFDPFQVYYSGFYSQGDGACFVGSWRRNSLKIELLKSYAPIDQELHRIAEELAKAPKEMVIQTTHSGRYYHENSMEFTLDNDEVIGLEQILNLKGNLKAFAKWIYRQLEKQYEYECKDETIAEAVAGNEYYEDGRLYTRKD